MEGLRRQRVQYGADPTECSDKSGLALRQIAFIYRLCRRTGVAHTAHPEAQNSPPPHLTHKWPLLDFTALTTPADLERQLAHKPGWTSRVGSTVSTGTQFLSFCNSHSSDILCVVHKSLICSQSTTC
jgi:hypothetical protein